MSTPESKLFEDLKPKAEGEGDKKPEPTPAVEDLPEEFKGKSSKELVELITQSRGKFQEMDGRIESLTKLLTEPDKPDVKPVEEAPPDPHTDPEGYYKFQHDKTVAPLAVEAFQRFADIERDRAVTKFKDFDRWGDEIDKLAGQMPLELRARKGSYEQAYRIVKANHLEEIEEEIMARGKAHSEVPSTPKREEPGPALALSEKQDEIRKKQGLTVDEYNAWAKVSELPPEAK